MGLLPFQREKTYTIMRLIAFLGVSIVCGPFYVMALKIMIELKPNNQGNSTNSSGESLINQVNDNATGDLSKVYKTLPALSRIVGGNMVKAHSMPWQVSMVERGQSTNICGGTVLCPKFILTAGHCTEKKSPSDWEVLTGAHQLRGKKEKSQRRYEIRKFHDHPKYKMFEGGYSDYDYSILELKKRIEMIPEVRSVYLPKYTDRTKFKSRTPLLVSGWGKLKQGGSEPNELMSVTVPYVLKKQCKKAFREPKSGVHFKITSRMLCAGEVMVGGIDACQGDSGGPLTWLNDGKVKIVGVVSFGYDCAAQNAPGVYGKITTVLNWIKGIAGKCYSKAIKKGYAMTKDKLDDDVIRRFREVTNRQERQASR